MKKNVVGLIGILIVMSDSDYPKMLAIYPDEKHYLTINNTSNDIVSYTINYEKGFSLQNGAPVKVDKPNCIYILKLEE